MKPKDVIPYQMICNFSGGMLYFLPSIVDGKEIYGYSIFCPNETDEEATIATRSYTAKRGDTVYLGSIPKIRAPGRFEAERQLLTLANFRNVSGEDMETLFLLLSTLKIVHSEPTIFVSNGNQIDLH